MNLFLDANRLLVDEFWWAFMTALLLGAAVPIAGAFLVVRRVPFLALALPQSAFAGMAGALLAFPLWIKFTSIGATASLDDAGVEASNGYLFAGALGAVGGVLALLALAARGRGAQHTGSHAALAYVAALATGEVLRGMTPMGEQHLEHLIHGELIATNQGHFTFLSFTVAPLVGWLLLRRGRILFASAEPITARALGLPVTAIVLGLYVVLGGVVAASVPVVGPLVVLSLLLGPPVMVRPIARSTRGHLAWSAAVGLLSAYAGCVLAVMLDWPLGASVAAAGLILGGAVVGSVRLGRFWRAVA